MNGTDYTMLRRQLEMKHELDFMLLEYKYLTDTYSAPDKELVLDVKKAEIKLKEYKLKKFSISCPHTAPGPSAPAGSSPPH